MKLEELVGQPIDRICIDYAVSLLTDRGTELRISTQFSFRAESGPAFLADPEIPGEYLAKIVLAVLREPISRASVDEDAAKLTVDFLNGAQIAVASDPDYEAWTLTTSGGGRLVAGVGGGVHVWEDL